MHTLKWFLLLFVAFELHYSNGQGCVIDTTNFELISPASQYLPCVERNQPYSATIQIFAIPSIGFSVDSFLITSFSGMPNGITYSFNPSPMKLYPYDHGCVLLSGETTDTVGIYDIEYDGYVYLQQGTPSFDYIRANFPGQLPEYSLRVIDSGAFCSNAQTGIKESNKLDDFTIYPNPTSGLVSIQPGSSINGSFAIRVVNLVGKVVYYSRYTPGTSMPAAIDLSSHPKGTYFIQLRDADKVYIYRIAVQ